MAEFEYVDILLVEDTATDAEMTIRALRKRGLANNLVWLKDGSEALDYLLPDALKNRRNALPKLILLDVKMPKLDGIDVLRRIMQDEKLCMIPVVMLTSSAEECDIIDSYRLGANSYIVKPMNLDDFDRIVSEIGMYWMLVNKLPDK